MLLGRNDLVDAGSHRAMTELAFAEIRLDEGKCEVDSALLGFRRATELVQRLTFAGLDDLRVFAMMADVQTAVSIGRENNVLSRREEYDVVLPRRPRVAELVGHLPGKRAGSRTDHGVQSDRDLGSWM